MSNRDNANGQQGLTRLIINGRPTAFDGNTITYSQLVALANLPQAPGGMLYSVTYSGPHTADGSLAEGGSVSIVNGMKFDVTPTNRS